MSTKRPDNIRHVSDLTEPNDFSYRESCEKFAHGARLGKAFGLERVGVNYEILPPGYRTSWPHAHMIEEEFIFVLEGEPDLWQDGELYRLKPGDAVGYPGGTGIAHTLINNTKKEVRMLVVGENLKGCKITYPMHPKHNQKMAAEGHLWKDCPINKMGSHDGFPSESKFKDEDIQRK